ncbi:DUF429 domain-containing protein [Halobaculum sp. WSA2]|uniref:DUF429 domain-containing protein n=1 Tax=Halobaculum saliterrae TaxID=2073113 RepID=A0A6B0SXW0_9EURY|nr:DUF429 domain-containing protein [Halobaculum saliterrae]MXR40800.1 DUF429 domain-containing protein [Halobaculum saliterrae]
MSTAPWRYIGVDWDSGAWVAVGYPTDGEPAIEIFDTIDELWQEHGDSANRIVVDIPIGLCGSLDDPGDCLKHDETLSRRCDRLARKVIGPRSSSVFPAPCSAAVNAASNNAATYSEINETNREHTGKGLTQQAASIADGIRQVDALLETTAADETVVEGHPEVCFRAFADEDLQFNKSTVQGMVTRLDAMAASTEYEPGSWRDLARQLDGNPGIGTDDLIDALGLALTARAGPDEIQTLPNTESLPTDTRGRPMRIVYRRSEPFAVELSAN